MLNRKTERERRDKGKGEGEIEIGEREREGERRRHRDILGAGTQSKTSLWELLKIEVMCSR